MTLTPARAMIQSTHNEWNRGEDDRSLQAGGGHPECFECPKLACLEIVDLVDEPLEFREGVAALFGS